MVDALTPVPDTPRELLTLEQLPGVGLVTLRRLLEHFGSARAALSAPDRSFEAIAGPGSGRTRSAPELRAAVDGALARADALGARVTTWSDPLYPPTLRSLADPPPVLFLRGPAELLLRSPIVTIVGARRSTARGRDVAERLGAALARAGVTVASGLALGVDGAAHAGALRAGGDTIAVLGTGPDVAYPGSHRRLFARIVRDGLIVSEFLPGTRAAPHHYPRRNRILAGIASTIVVVEAGRRSGSLITVDHALDLGLDVWAVPGPIDTAVCAGSNRLLVDGARPLVSIEGFVEAVGGRALGDPTVEVTPPRVPTQRSPTDLEARVYAALSTDAVAVDELSAVCASPVGEVLAVLTALELHGEVERLPGMRYRRAA